jgi:hypothetical protein
MAAQEIAGNPVNGNDFIGDGDTKEDVDNALSCASRLAGDSTNVSNRF